MKEINNFLRGFAPEFIAFGIYCAYVAAQEFSPIRQYSIKDAEYTRLMVLGSVAVGALSLFLLSTALRILVSPFRRIGAAAIVLSLFVYASLCFYNWKTNSTLTLSLLFDHIRELRTLEAWIVVSDQLSPVDYAVLTGFYVVVWFLEWKFEFCRRVAFNKRSLLIALALGSIWLIAVLLGSAISEPLTLLARSALGESFRLRQHGIIIANHQIPEFPYVQKPVNTLDRSKHALGQPHIFVLMIESFNARFVTERAADGSPLMPRFQDAIRRGVWADPCYGNSTYTIKGQEAVVTSLPPLLSGNLASRHENVRLHALPLILREQGYDTIFFQAHRDLKFAGTEGLMRRCGFETLQAMDQTLTKTMDSSHFWGWGVQDDAFFDRFFAWLGERRTRENSHSPGDSPKPLFVLLATISSHSPYDAIPRSLCDAFPNPTSKVEWYSNVMRQVDRGIGRFLDNLDHSIYATNAIVLITADHSVPMGEHGTSSIQSGFFEESFRIPCLILWPGKLEPKRLTNGPYSQVDFAPTLLDLAGISALHHFTGKSLLQQTSVPRKAVSMQSYDGLYIVAREASWKYVFHNATGREFLFDLARDPEEHVNRFGECTAELRTRMRREVGRLWLHDELVAQNRIWPEPSEGQIDFRHTTAKQSNPLPIPK